jgi:GNAT superfamily N-acetyltransferase
MTDRRLELVEAEAYASLSSSAGLPVARVAGAVCVALPPAAQNTMLNRVHALGLAGPVDEAGLDEIDGFFRAHRVTYAIGLSPLAPPELGPALASRGFEPGYAWMKFTRDLDEPGAVTTDLRVEEPSDGRDFGAVLSAAYGFPAGTMSATFAGLPGSPGWSCFVAYDGDEPVGAGALFADEGVGWLGLAGTVPERRGRGAQNAILAARIRRARQLRLEALATETGERVPDRPSNSYRNILRAGFEEAYLRPNLIAPA